MVYRSFTHYNIIILFVFRGVFFFFFFTNRLGCPSSSFNRSLKTFPDSRACVRRLTQSFLFIKHIIITRPQDGHVRVRPTSYYILYISLLRRQKRLYIVNYIDNNNNLIWSSWCASLSYKIIIIDQHSTFRKSL